MKYITFVVPCYNSQNYMERCILSLLPGGEDVEIIIVDDGSTDRTAEIADEYEKAYPGIIRAVHQENGGHGSGINKGLELAAGIYFKVVDSDDWLDERAYKKLLGKIKSFVSHCRRYGEENAILPVPDLFICNYVYDHLEEGRWHVMKFDNVFPKGELCGWDDIRRFRPSQYLIMHALLFRTDILRRCNLKLPEHFFYVDNLFSYQPLPYVRKIYYMNINLYHYYLGRTDQSVNEKVLMQRIDQQIYVTNMLIRCENLALVKRKYPKLAEYMKRSISIMMSISSIHLPLIHSREAEEKRKQLWEDLRQYDQDLYHQIRYTTLSGFTYLPGKAGAWLTIAGYRLAKRIYKFQ